MTDANSHLLTIVIPTYNNRHRYLRRVLEYYKQLTVPILIADSSALEFKFENSQKGNNIHYFHLRGVSYTEKLYRTIRTLRTPYTLLAADDDFITPKGMQYCLEFLQRHPDYSSAQGHMVTFRRKGQKIEMFPWMYHCAGMDINHNSSMLRVRNIFNQHVYLHWSVHRTENLLDTFSLASKLIDDFAGMIGPMLDIISITNGKHIVLPVFYIAQELAKDSARNIYLPPPLLRFSPKHKENYNSCLKTMTTHLSKKENIPFSEAEEAIDYAFHSSPYFTLNSDSKNVSYPLQRFSTIKKITDNIPGSTLLKKSYSRLVHHYLHYKNRIRPKKSVKEVTEKKLPAYPFTDSEAFSDWEYIKSIILKMK